ncbi:hypothetical protein BYT27DRAFT_6494310 [Phlegmacium glaucopus]|nr:hypothetical protein BYT27DRAFT_6494310 [Phlegmacium glaucopus]
MCALLPIYLSALPEPILLPALFHPIWDWRSGGTWGRSGYIATQVFLMPYIGPHSRTYTNPTESTRILVAQLVHHLPPSPHFSLPSHFSAKSDSLVWSINTMEW